MRHDPDAQREDHRVRVAQAEIAVKINVLRDEHDLTDIEMLQAITLWEATTLKFMVRRERER